MADEPGRYQGEGQALTLHACLLTQPSIGSLSLATLSGCLANTPCCMMGWADMARHSCLCSAGCLILLNKHSLWWWSTA